MLTQLLNRYISKLKGQSYVLDDRIPAGYLLSLVWARLLMKLRGLFSGIKADATPFVGPCVVLKARSLIRAGVGLSIGRQCYIDAVSVDGIRLGNHVSIGPRTKIECTGNLQHLGKGLQVGDHVGLGSDNFYGCAGGIVIGQDTIVGNFVSFHAENHNHEDLSTPIRLQGVRHQGIVVGANCWIGAKATILDGAVVEDGCIVAAGALVTAGVYKSNGIYGGVPARLIKYRSES